MAVTTYLIVNFGLFISEPTKRTAIATTVQITLMLDMTMKRKQSNVLATSCQVRASEPSVEELSEQRSVEVVLCD